MRKDKTKVTELMTDVLMNKYTLEISRKDRLENKGYKLSLLIILFTSLYLIIKCITPMKEFKGYFIFSFIFTFIYSCSFTVGVLALSIVYGIKNREEVDILSQWDVLTSCSYEECTESIKYAMLDVIKKLEIQNEKLANNVKYLTTLNVVVGIGTFLICMWRIPW